MLFGYAMVFKHVSVYFSPVNLYFEILSNCYNQQGPSSTFGIEKKIIEKYFCVI